MAPDASRYIFLDRDGVLNRKMREGAYVAEWSQFDWLPGAEEAVARLNRAGRMVILVTNQRGIALGRMTEAGLGQLHDRMRAHLFEHGAHLDAIYYCPHDRNVCRCRKPETGLFEEAFRAFHDAQPGNSLMIGDSLSDIEAGRRMGMYTVFITGERERQKEGAAIAEALADATASSLLEAVEVHLGLAAGRSEK